MAEHAATRRTFSVNGEGIVVVAMFGMTRTAKVAPGIGEATHVLIEKGPRVRFKPARSTTSPASTSPRAELDRLPRDLLRRR